MDGVKGYKWRGFAGWYLNTLLYALESTTCGAPWGLSAKPSGASTAEDLRQGCHVLLDAVRLYSGVSHKMVQIAKRLMAELRYMLPARENGY